MSAHASPLLPPGPVVSALRAAGCVFAEDEAELILSTARTPEEATAMVRRRAAGLGIGLDHAVAIRQSAAMGRVLTSSGRLRHKPRPAGRP